jgi:hypothetical protein
MADLSITAASVLPGTNAIIDKSHAFGATVAQGKSVYLDSTTHKWGLADSNSGTVGVRQATGIALNAGSDGQPAAVQTGGQITIGATLTPGIEYFLSDTPGGICPVADVGSGEYVCLIGVALSASVLDLNFKYTGVSN